MGIKIMPIHSIFFYLIGRYEKNLLCLVVDLMKTLKMNGKLWKIKGLYIKNNHLFVFIALE